MVKGPGRLWELPRGLAVHPGYADICCTMRSTKTGFDASPTLPGNAVPHQPAIFADRLPVGTAP